MKKIKKISLVSSLPLVAPPFFIIACSSNNSTNDENKEQIFNNNLLNSFVKEMKIGDDFYNNDIELNDSLFIYDGSVETNLFSILFNSQNTVNNDQSLSLDQIFFKHPYKINSNLMISFSFDYTEMDSFGNLIKPYILNNEKNIIIVPVKIMLVDPKTNFIKSSMYKDILSLSIIDKKVNNKNDLGFNGTSGKTIQFLNNKYNKPITFMEIPKQIIDLYLDLNFITTNNDNWRANVIFNNEKEQKWRNKSFEEAKNVSDSFKNPNPYQTRTYKYYYSIIESYFDQIDWNYPRFTIEFKPKLLSLDNTLAEKYGLSLSKKYTYVDKTYKFENPTSTEINSAIERNNKISSSLSTIFGKTTLANPTIGFTTNQIQMYGVEEVVKWFSNNKNLIIPPKSYVYRILDDDIRNIDFEIEKISVSEDNSAIIDVTIKILVGNKRELKGSASYIKKFNTKTWKWE